MVFIFKSLDKRSRKHKEVLSNPEPENADALVETGVPEVNPELSTAKGAEDEGEDNSAFLSSLDGKSDELRDILHGIEHLETLDEPESLFSTADFKETDALVEKGHIEVIHDLVAKRAKDKDAKNSDFRTPTNGKNDEVQHAPQDIKHLDADKGLKIVPNEADVLVKDAKTEEGLTGGRIEGGEAENNSVFLSSLEVKSDELRHLLQGVEHLDAGIDKFLERLDATINEYSIPEGYTEQEKYFVNKPYAMVSILYNDEVDKHLYYMVEPKLSDVERFFLADIEDKLGVTLLFTDMEEGVKGEEKERILKKKIDEVVERYHIEFEPDSLKKISYYLVRDLIQFGKIDVLMRDRFVEDISCDGYNIPIYVYHWKYGSMETNIISNESELDSFVVKIAQKGGKHLSLSDPLVGITLEDGSRAQVSLGSEITTRGSTFTIRRFREVLITAADLIRWGTFTPEEMAYLWLAVENGKSILFVGGTASGKTTSLNAISLFIPQTAKIITIEDTRELRLPHENWIPSITRAAFMGSERGTVDMYELLKVALRQRPEYLIVGEVRGKEAMTLFQAMSTGHTSFSTFHADSVDATIHRLEYPPLSIPRSMLQSLDIFCIQAQVFIGKQRVRRNLELTENLGIDPTTRNIKTRRIFEWNPAKDTFEGLNISIPESEKSASHVTVMVSKVLKEIGRFNGWSGSQIWNEFETRARLLKVLAEREIVPQEFISTIRTFQANPEKALKGYGI